MTAKILSIVNHKGGVGKTTSAANIAAGLNRLGKKVLLIDLDPQSNLTDHLGISVELEKTVYGALSGRYPLPVLTLANGIDLVPSTLDLAGAEIELSSKIGRELTLMKLLKPIIDNYDYILIDCPPSLGILTVNALTASDIALVPVTPGKFSLMGLQRIIEIFNIVKDLNNNKLKDFRILITNFDARKSLPKQFVEYVNGAYGDKVFKTHIRTNAALEDAQMRQATVFETDLKCNGAEDYLSVSKEITEDKYINI